MKLWLQRIHGADGRQRWLPDLNSFSGDNFWRGHKDTKEDSSKHTTNYQYKYNNKPLAI